MIKQLFGKRLVAILFAILAVASTARAQNATPAPLITSVSPVSALPGGAQFTLTVNGVNFVSGRSTVKWNNTTLTTTFVNSHQLTATVTANLIAAVNTGWITVSNALLNGNAEPAIEPDAVDTTPIISNVVYFPVAPTTSTIYVNTQNATTGAGPLGIAAGDFNKDGKLDLAVSNTTAGTVSILLGNGDGTFQTQTTFNAGTSPYGIAVTDLDGDGNLDLVIGSLSTTITLARGSGTGTFTTTSLTGLSSPAYPAIADINAGGKVDMAVANIGTSTIKIFSANGTGGFETPTTLTPPGTITSLILADFSGDGKLDIAAADSTTGNVDVFLGNGNLGFGTVTSFAAVTSPRTMAAGDFNKDGKLDLAVASNDGGGIALLTGTGTGTFNAASSIVATGDFNAITAGDFNNDGKLDIITLSTDGTLQAWFGNGDGTFQAPLTISTGDAGNQIALGNFATAGGLGVAVPTTNAVAVSVPTLSLNPSSFNFQNVNIGQTGVQAFTLTNPRGTTATITSVGFTGTNPGDYSQTNTCGASLLSGHSCVITVTFTPTVMGASAALLSVVDNAPASPQTAALSGTGIAPVVDLSAESIAFGNQATGSSSAATPVVLTNTGTAPLTGLVISIVGTNPGDFSQTNNCTATMAINATCTVNVTFTPTTLGARDATLQFPDNAQNSPQSVDINGTGVMPPFELLYVTAPPTTLMAGSNIGVISVGVYTMDATLVTTSTASIHVTITGPNGFNSAQTQSAVAGVATFDFSAVPLDIAGIYTTTATTGLAVVAKHGRAVPADGGGLVPAVATTTVTPQISSTQMNVTGFPSPTFSNVPHPFTVSVTDAFSNPITTYAGTVTLSSTDPLAVLVPSPYTFTIKDAGAHTFTGTLVTLGTQSISATDGELSGTQSGIQVNQRPQFVVNTLVDDGGTGTCPGSGACSLRSAVTQSNTLGAGDITVDTSSFSGVMPFTVTLTNGVLELNSNINIIGPGEAVFAVSGEGSQTVFLVDDAAIATISGLTVTLGESSDNGGAITSDGTLTLTNMAVTHSAATLDGGGIYNTGTLTVNSSVISGNVATVNGGGVASTGTTVFYDSTISGNTATGNGGGIDNDGPFSVPQSTFFGNTAADGSAIENEASGITELLQCTVTGNTATIMGGGTITNLDTDEGAMTILNSIDAGNSSSGGDCITCGGQSGFNVFSVNAETLNLGPLTNNGGPTQTLLPQLGSPVIGAGSVALDQNTGLPQSLANDQRGAGFARIINNMVDLGSVQANAGPASFLTLNVTDSSVAGQPLVVTVSAFTAAENPAASFTDTVHFTSSDPQAQLPADYTFTGADAGTHVFSVTLETSGAQTITVTDVQQSTLTATQTVTVSAGPASSIIALAGSGQTTTPGTTFPTALEAEVTDAFGNPISGISITFTAPTTGASGTFAGGVSAVTISTLTTGIATATAFTANNTAGQYTVTAGMVTQQATIKTSVIRAGAPPLTPASFTLTNGVPPSYTVTANPATLSIVQGQAGSTVLTFTPVGGFTGTVSLSCSGLPADSNCVFVPAQAVMTGNDAVVTVTLTVNTTGTNGQLSQLLPGGFRIPGMGGSNGKLAGLLGILLAAVILGWSATQAKRPRYALAVLALLVVAMAGAGLTACGGGSKSSQPSSAATVPGTYTVNVSASAGSGGAHTAVVMITIVQQ
jgi:FG-GAP-like repeat/Abnormal spindle-like microcephaly-assoc'd, ASPM-SPD-2-Hydin